MQKPESLNIKERHTKTELLNERKSTAKIGTKQKQKKNETNGSSENESEITFASKIQLILNHCAVNTIQALTPTLLQVLFIFLFMLCFSV